jgi:glycerol kinase
MRYILALDQGTTSSRALLFDSSGKCVGVAQKEIAQFYPKAGWVEQDPMDIWGTQSGVAREVLEKTGVRPGHLAAIGITNQRETTIIWERDTGRPVCNAIVWQCRRTAAICTELKARGLEPYIAKTTGLVVDAYFSATKIKWVLDAVPGLRARASNGELLFGNVDTWLIWNLTRGKVHVTDYSNASRTMLFNIHELRWDRQLLEEMSIPEIMLPEVRESSCLYGYTDPGVFGGARIPIAGDAGDQHAALFGQACFNDGMAKNTYGTGCFMLMNTGSKPVPSKNGLLTTVAWGVGGKVDYALEGSIFMAGASVQWLRDEMRLIDSAAQSEDMANAVPDSNGVYLVPAFAGLGAPYWDMFARGAIVGLTRGANRNHIVRATLESIAFQTRDVLQAMEDDSRIRLKTLRVDGGAVANNFLMQFQSDILGVPVDRPVETETTALGAAFLAGLAVGFWNDKSEISAKWSIDRTFVPSMADDLREQKYAGWKDAVARSRSSSGDAGR